MVRKIVYPDADAMSVEMISGTRLERLEALGEFEIHCDDAPEDDAVLERLAGAQAALSGWGISNAVLAELPNLEVISFTGLGASTYIDIAEAARRNITVTHTLSAATTIAAASPSSWSAMSPRKASWPGRECWSIWWIRCCILRAIAAITLEF